MLARTVSAARPILILSTLVCLAGGGAGQSATSPHPATVKGFDPRPDPPGKTRTPAEEQLAKGVVANGTLGSDVTSKKGITIGSTFAAWGTLVTIPDRQAYSMERGKCGFRIGYDMVNQGSVATPLVFTNTLAAGSTIVSTDDSLLLNPLQAKQVATRAWLSPGTYDLILRLDAGNTVPETNELNNVMRVRMTLDGKCQGPLGSPGPAIRGDDKTHAPFLPPGSPNTIDQTDAKPAPHGHSLESGYQTPDTKAGNDAIIINYHRLLVDRLGPKIASAIIVQANGGMVMLTGKVPTSEAKAQAEQAVRSVSQESVDNRLAVER